MHPAKVIEQAIWLICFIVAILTIIIAVVVVSSSNTNNDNICSLTITNYLFSTIDAFMQHKST